MTAQAIQLAGASVTFDPAWLGENEAWALFEALYAALPWERHRIKVYGRTIDGWIEPQPAPPLPRHVLGLIEALGEYEFLAAEAAWSGDRRDAVRALAANPLVRTLPRAERLYAELAVAHRAHLPGRLAA